MVVVRREKLNDGLPDDSQLPSLMVELRMKLRIDKNDLDNELAEQSDVYFRIGEQESLAISQRDQMQSYYKQAQAQADTKIRKQYADKDEKITETRIASMTAMDPEVIKAKDEFFRLS